MVLHGAAFGLMLMLDRGGNVDIVRLLVLKGAESHPLGIVLHPFATTGLLSILFVVLALWSLGAQLEPRLNAPRLVGLYVLGNLTAGAVYFGAARLAPGLSGAPLDSPIGALAALCLAAWRQLRNEPVQVFGRVTSAGVVYGICALIVLGLALVASGVGGLAWLAAALAGGGSTLVVERLPAIHLPHRLRPQHTVRPYSPRPVVPSTRRHEAEIDIEDILAKISREGLAALTEAERARLEAARQAKLRDSRRRV
jgi:membrane associated rhomboid family serine protease